MDTIEMDTKSKVDKVLIPRIHKNSCKTRKQQRPQKENGQMSNLKA